MERPEEPNTAWSIDFVSDVLECGRKFRVLNVIDDNVAVAQEVSMSFPLQRVIKVMAKVIWLNGKSRNIRYDNGSEFIAKEFQAWCHGNDIRILYTQHGCPARIVISSASMAPTGAPYSIPTSLGEFGM